MERECKKIQTSEDAQQVELVCCPLPVLNIEEDSDIDQDSSDGNASLSTIHWDN